MLKKIALAGIIIGLICSVSYGEEEATNQNPDILFELIKDTLVLDGKGDDYVSFCRRKFDITSYTIIKNESGMLIPLEEISIPCEAMVSYYKKPGKKGQYVVVSIEEKGELQPKPD